MGRLKANKQGWTYFFLALPFMLIVILFRYVPLGGWALSFFDYRAGIPLFNNPFVGFHNFQRLFTSSEFARVMKNTAVFSLLNYLLLPLPMIFAILLNEIPSRNFRKSFQTLSTLPHFISWIVVYSLAFALFSEEGVVNQIFQIAGFGEQYWLINPDVVYPFQTVILQWKNLGWSAIIYIAALTGIDQELYEAAKVDGANRLHCVRYITLPGLMPTFVVLALLAVANFVNNGLDQYFVFNNAFVADQIEVLDLYIYRVGMQRFDFSYATAAGIFKSVISIALLFFTNYLAKKFRGESII